jgi:integrase
MNRPRKKDKHLPPCVYAKHGAYWHVKRGKWVKLGMTLKGALEAYAALHDSPRGGMSELIDHALEQLAPTLKPSTLKQYKGAAKKLKKAFAEFAPDQVQPKHIAAFKVGFARIPNMTNRCISLLRQVFSYALEQQLVTTNPATGIKRHKENKRRRLIQLPEYAAIYAEAGPRLQVVMDLLIRTGERVRDVLKIRRADLLPEGIRFEQMKTGARRIVPWTPELHAVVERAKTLDGKLTSLTLLRNRRGKAPDYRTVRDQWHKACEAAGVTDANLHDLRAVAATWAKKQGLNPTLLLGHSSPAQTERYLRDREELIAEGPSFGHLIDIAKKSS